MTAVGGPRPPRFWATLARVIIRGRDRALLREEIAESFAGDLERGVARGRAGRRYARNVLATSASLALGAVTGGFTRGAGLDARLGIRLLGKQPLLTAVAMLALGLGIPASLSMHHVFNQVFSPLPAPEGERLQGIRHWNLATRRPMPSRVHDYEVWRGSLTSFESIGAARSYGMNLRAGDDGVGPVWGAEVSASTFDLLGATPLLGRSFGPDDEVRGAPDVVILGEDLWESRFASDPNIVGKTVRIGGREHAVVGVVPSAMRFPYDEDLWLPLRAKAVDYEVGGGPELLVFGRLADGVASDEAETEVALVAERQADDDPVTYDRLVGEVVEMSMLILREADLTSSYPELVLAQAVILLVLFMVCGNVATLLLARTATRHAELAIRTALGASRARIVTQLFTEALVLSLVATGAGLVLGELTARYVMSVAVPAFYLPYWVDLTLDARIVATALGLAAVSAVLAGVVPALKATSRGVQSNLQRASGGASVRFGLGSNLLIVAEVVLSVGFLAVGGTLIRTVFQDTDAAALGFEPARFVAAGVSLPWLDPAEHPEYQDAEAFRRRLAEIQRGVLDRLRAADGVRGVGMAWELPGHQHPRRRPILQTREGEIADLPAAAWAGVDVDFFDGLNRPILAGRGFSASDLEGAAAGHRPAVIVNTTFVDEVLGGRSPLGQRFRFPTPRGADPGAEVDWYEIVGVVGSFGMNPGNPVRDAGIYHPIAPGEDEGVGFVVEVAGDAADFAPELRAIVASVDADAMVYVGPVADVIEGELDFLRWAALMELALAAVAFLLAVAGLYALMSFTVSQRTREIGIRTALGAKPRAIVATVARRAALQLGVGLTLGAAFATLLLRELVDDYSIVPTSIPWMVGVTVTLATFVGIAACASPTVRCLRIQPTEALREG